MHIALFNRSFYPDTAATGQLLTELCAGLVETHKCRVSVVAGPALNPAHGYKAPQRWGVRWESYRGIEILRSGGTRFSKDRFIGRAANYLSYFSSACYAGLLLDRPDIVVAATDPPIIGLAAWLAAKRFRVPLVMTFQDIFPEVGRLLEDFHSDTVDRILQSVNCFLVRKAARSVVIGETMRRRLIESKRAVPERTVIISNWADCSRIVPVARINDFSHRHGLDGKFVVMHSGNIGLSQALECVVDIAERFLSLPAVRFVIVGDGVKKSALVRGVRDRGLDNVQFLPFQPRERLKELFGAADVFLISLKSGLAGYIVPSKLYGILASGRPYVAAVEKDSEVAAVTHKYKCGLIAEPGHTQEIVDRIMALYADPSMCESLGKNARDAAFEFDQPIKIQAYFDLFRDLVQDQRGPSAEPQTAL